MKKLTLIGLALAGTLLMGTQQGLAAQTFNLPGIGEMKEPAGISFEPGVQKTLLFSEAGGVQKFFNSLRVTGSQYFTMTYSKPPDFSYGWAMSHRLGIPVLFETGEFKHKDDSLEEQMEVYADYINRKVIENGGRFSGTGPLKKIRDRSGIRWEGYFTLRSEENGIPFNEAYWVILQRDGYFVTLGIINADADQKEAVREISRMIAERKIPKNVNYADIFTKK